MAVALLVAGTRSAPGADPANPVDAATRTAQLFEAVKKSEASAVAWLLAEGADPNAVDPAPGGGGRWPNVALKGGRPLHYAARTGRADIVRMLLEKGAQVDPADEFQWTPLAFAAFHGHVEAAKILLARGADRELLFADVEQRLDVKHSRRCRCHSGNALVIAAQKGHLEVVRLLLDAGSATDAHDIVGRTPLAWAANRGDLPMLRMLLDRGAEPDLAFPNARPCEDPLTVLPIDWAAQHGHDAAIRMLLAAGADVRKSSQGILLAAGGGHVSTIRLLRGEGVALDQRQPLVLAAVAGRHSDALRFLVEDGADPNVRGRKPHETALVLAAQQGDVPTLRLLLDRGADPNLSGPLVCAAGAGHLEAMRVLIRAGARLQQTYEWDAATALGAAAVHGKIEAMRILIDAGADLRFPSRSHPPIFWTVQHGHFAGLKLLVEAGVAPDSGDTVRTAAAHGRAEFLDYLVARGARLERPQLEAALTFFGNGPTVQRFLDAGVEAKFGDDLRRAAYRGMTDVVSLLVARGADPSGRDPATDPSFATSSPLGWAVSDGHEATARKLLELGADPDAGDPLLKAVSHRPTLIPLLLEAGARVTDAHLAVAKKVRQPDEVQQRLLEHRKKQAPAAPRDPSQAPPR